MIKGAGLIPVSEGRGPVVLMYHSVESKINSGPNVWSVSAATFRSHLRLLQSERWHTACIRELRYAESLPLRTVLITFDDGFENNFDNGFRLLREADMKATWFVVTNSIGKYSHWEQENVPSKPMLSVEQLKEMVEAGMEVGAHTRNHRRLAGINAELLWDEVLGSKEDLEGILGHPVVSFAYPYGEFNDPCVEAVRDAGYRVACSARPGWFGSEPDLLRVRRVSVFSHDNASVLARKLAFADNNVGWWRMAKYASDRLRCSIIK